MPADYSVSLTLSAIDQASTVIKNISGTLSDLQQKVAGMGGRGGVTSGVEGALKGQAAASQAVVRGLREEEAVYKTLAAEERVLTEQSRRLTEGTRQNTEATRQKTEGTRQDTEVARQNTEGIRQLVEGERIHTEQAKQATQASVQKTESTKRDTLETVANAKANKLNTDATLSSARAQHEGAKAQLTSVRTGKEQANTGKVLIQQDIQREKLTQAQIRTQQMQAKQQEQATRKADETSRAMSRLTGLVQRMIATFVIYKVVQGFSAMIDAAFKFNSVVEDSQVALAAMVLVSHNFTDAFGRSIPVADQFSASMGMARKEMKLLQIANLETAATLPELIQMFRQVRAELSRAPGASSSELVKLATGFALMGQTAGIPLNMMGEEIRSTIQGKMVPKQTRLEPLMRSLEFEGRPVTNQMLRDWKAAGTSLENLNKIFEFTKELTAEQQSNWTVLASNTKDALDIVLAEGFTPLFEYAKANLNTITEALKTPESAREIRKELKGISEAFIDVIENAKTVASAIARMGGMLDGGVFKLIAFSIKALAVAGAIKALGLALSLVGIEAFAAGSIFGGPLLLGIGAVAAAVLTLVTYWEKLIQIMGKTPHRFTGKEAADIQDKLTKGIDRETIAQREALKRFHALPEGSPARDALQKEIEARDIRIKRWKSTRWDVMGVPLAERPSDVTITQKPPFPPEDDEKKANKIADAKQKAAERLLALQAQLADLEGRSAEALKLERQHEIAEAERRNELILKSPEHTAEVKAINDLFDERDRILQKITIGMAAIEAAEAQQGLGQEPARSKGLMDLAQLRIDLLESEKKLSILRTAKGEDLLKIEESIAKAKESQMSLAAGLLNRQEELAKAEADRDMAAIRRAGELRDLKLDTMRFQFGQGLITRGGMKEALLGEIPALKAEFDKIFEATGTRPSEIELSQRILDKQQEIASLSINVWEEATAAIGGSFVSAFQDTRNPILSFFEDLAKSIRNILLRAAGEELVDKVREVLKPTTATGTGAKGLISSVIGAVGGFLGIGGAQALPGPGQPGGTQGPVNPNAAVPMSGLAKAGMGSAMLASLAGSFIPGRGGSIISGAGTGAMIGGGIAPLLSASALAGPVGMAVGAMAGGLFGGIFGGGKKEKDPVRAEIKQWVSGELWPELSRLSKMGFSAGAFGSTRPGGTDFFKGMGFEAGIPQEILKRMQEMAKEMTDILSSAIGKAFDAFSISGSWRKFKNELLDGISDYVRQGMIKGLLKGSALTKALAPLFEAVEQAARQFGKGKIGAGAFESQVNAAFQKALPRIERTQDLVQSLSGMARRLDQMITGRKVGDLFSAVPQRFMSSGTSINMPISATINERADVDLLFSNVGFALQQFLPRAGFG